MKHAGGRCHLLCPFCLGNSTLLHSLFIMLHLLIRLARRAKNLELFKVCKKCGTFLLFCLSYLQYLNAKESRLEAKIGVLQKNMKLNH